MTSVWCAPSRHGAAGGLARGARDRVIRSGRRRGGQHRPALGAYPRVGTSAPARPREPARGEASDCSGGERRYATVPVLPDLAERRYLRFHGVRPRRPVCRSLPASCGGACRPRQPHRHVRDTYWWHSIPPRDAAAETTPAECGRHGLIRCWQRCAVSSAQSNMAAEACWSARTQEGPGMGSLDGPSFPLTRTASFPTLTSNGPFSLTVPGLRPCNAPRSRRSR
jgi:hypothetical protein